MLPVPWLGEYRYKSYLAGGVPSPTDAATAPTRRPTRLKAAPMFIFSAHFAFARQNGGPKTA